MEKATFRITAQENVHLNHNSNIYTFKINGSIQKVVSTHRKHLFFGGKIENDSEKDSIWNSILFRGREKEGRKGRRSKILGRSETE